MNSRRKLNSLVTLAAIACLLAGCRKAKNTPINQEMLKYLTYPNGSYWVYQDSATGRIDSFVFLGGETTYKYYTGDDFNTYDRYLASMRWYNVTADTLVSISRWELRDNELRYFTGSVFIYWPIVDGWSIDAGDRKYRVCGTQVLDVPGQAGVVCFRLHHNYPYLNDANAVVSAEDDFFYNKEIGFVRILLNSPKENLVLNLIRFKK